MKSVHSTRLIPPVALIGIVWLLDHRITRLYWLYDDAFHLHQVSTHTVGQILFDPHFWRALPNQVFAPMLFLSLKTDLAMFGLDPRPFYIHHLIVLAIAVALLYETVRLWLPPLESFAAALVFVAGPPLAPMAAELMHRHYIEGLILALLSVILLKRDRPILSAIAYFIAMSAKEIFVPLIAILALMERRARMPVLLPHAIAIVVYAIWRTAMLGPNIRAYGWAVRRSEWLVVLLTLPSRAVQRFGNTALVAVVIVCVVIVLIRLRESRLPIAVGALAALIPIVPVAAFLEPRYVFALWLLAAIASAFVVRALPRAGWIALGALVIVALISYRLAESETFREARRMSDEARFVTSHGSDDLLLDPAIPSAAMGEMTSWMAPRHASWVYDRVILCEHPRAAHVFTWSTREHHLVEQPPDCRNIVHCPLSAAFDFEHGSLFWDLGPYAGGTYRFLLADGLQAFTMPRHGGFQLGGVPGITLRVGYTAPAGWSCYSPDIVLDFRQRRTFRWERR